MAESTDLSHLLQGWTPPDGLNRSRPRPVGLTGGGIFVCAVAVLMAVGGIVGAAMLSQHGRRQQAEARRMAAEGQEAEGVVTRLWHNGGRNDEHRVAYRFAVDGSEHSGRATVRTGFWKTLRVGSPIAVRYLPSNPGRNYPSASPPAPVPAWLPVLLGTAGLVVGGLLPLKIARQRSLLADGRPVPGVVRRYRRVYVHQGASHTVMHYEFPLLGGGVCKGRAETHKKAPEGSTICVLYDPDNPRRSAPYPMCLVKLIDR